MNNRDILDVVFGFALVLKIVSDTLAATVTQNGDSYNGMSLTATPTFGPEKATSLVYSLSILFVVGILIRPPATLAVVRTPGVILDVIIVSNLLVAIGVGGVYFADWVEYKFN